MNKQEFLEELRKGLSGLPHDDVEQSIDFYNEIISDHMEEGLTEEEAIADVGRIEDIVSQIISEITLPKLVKEKVKSKRALRVWEIVCLILGSPIWLSLLIAALAIVLSVYIVMWSVIISLWAIEGAVVGCALGGVLSSVIFIIQGYTPQGLCMLGAGLVGAGVSILLCFGCKEATKWILLLTKKMALVIKSQFIRKGNENE